MSGSEDLECHEEKGSNLCIPRDAGHPFHGIPVTDSTASRSPIPGDPGRFLSPSHRDAGQPVTVTPFAEKKGRRNANSEVVDEENKRGSAASYLLIAMKRFPALQTAGIKMLLNGPESFTPDDKMLLGPVPGVSGLFAITAMNSNGIALSPAAGRFLAEWIVEGSPSADVSTIDIRRFHECQSSPDFIERRVTEVAGFACRMHGPGDDYATARNVRCSPLHEVLERAGAHFKSVCGWERPHWIATDTEDRWRSWVANEFAAAQSSLLLVDRSTDVKIGLHGSRAGDWLEQLGPNRLNKQSGVLNGWIQLVDSDSRIQALCQALMISPDAWCLIAEPEQEARIKEYFRRVQVPDDVRIVDYTATRGLVELIGPSAVNAVAMCLPPTIVAIDSLMNSAVILVPADRIGPLWHDLLDLVAAKSGLVGGFLARESLRVFVGAPRFGSEIVPFVDACGTELEPNIAQSLVVNRCRKGMACILSLASSWELDGLSTGETVLLGTCIVGTVTSAVRLAGWDEALLLVRLAEQCAECEGLEVLAAGLRWPLRARSWKQQIQGSKLDGRT